MRSLRKLFQVFLIIGLVVFVASSSWAWTRSTSGTTTGKRGTGSFVKNKTWDKTTKSGSYSSSKTLPNGKTVSKSGTVTKNADGSYLKHGTITGPDGKVATIDKTITKNADGTRTVHGTVAGPDGKTTTIDKTIQKTDTGRVSTGSYTTSDGKTGTFERTAVNTKNADGSITQNVTVKDSNKGENTITRTLNSATEEPAVKTQ
jgi:hypothetical protein